MWGMAADGVRDGAETQGAQRGGAWAHVRGVDVGEMCAMEMCAPRGPGCMWRVHEGHGQQRWWPVVRGPGAEAAACMGRKGWRHGAAACRGSGQRWQHIGVAVAACDGAVVTCDGAVVACDGAVVACDGAVVACDGAVAHNGVGCGWHTGVQVVKGGGGTERAAAAGWRGRWRRDRESSGSRTERAAAAGWGGWRQGHGGRCGCDPGGESTRLAVGRRVVCFEV